MLGDWAENKVGGNQEAIHIRLCPNKVMPNKLPSQSWSTNNTSTPLTTYPIKLTHKTSQPETGCISLQLGNGLWRLRRHLPSLGRWLKSHASSVNALNTRSCLQAAIAVSRRKASEVNVITIASCLALMTLKTMFSELEKRAVNSAQNCQRSTKSESNGTTQGP